MVALSVSISARISPVFTVSPTLKFHLATTPSSIVSLSRGMLITSAIVIGVYEVKTDNLFVHIPCRTSHSFRGMAILRQIFRTQPRDLLPFGLWYQFLFGWHICFF